METNMDDQNVVFSSNSDKKKKCLTISEYNEITNWIDSLIYNKTDFILNKYERLKQKAISQYSQ